jgi:hypothetical protein
MFSPLSILTVAYDGSKQRYINNENWSDKQKREFQCKQNFKKKRKKKTLYAPEGSVNGRSMNRLRTNVLQNVQQHGCQPEINLKTNHAT